MIKTVVVIMESYSKNLLYEKKHSDQPSLSQKQNKFFKESVTSE